MAQLPTGSLQKAYLLMMTPSYKGASGLGMVRDEVSFMFNPKEYSVTKSAGWTDKSTKEKSVAMPEFTGAAPATLSVDVFLDATDPVRRPLSIKDALRRLFNACVPLPDTVDSDKPSPPFVIFGWGTTISFPSYLKSVTVKYTMFHPDGTPLRANAGLSLVEVPAKKSFQNPTSGGLVALRTHTVVDGDSLASIAQRQYGRPNNWRAIAEANGIDDPMRLPPGNRLLVPPTDSASRN